MAESGQTSVGVDPKGSASGSNRVLRGGSKDFGAGDCTSSYRSGLGPSYRYSDDGFRLVCGF